jgi:transposase
MVKRNLGAALRSKTPDRREREMLPRPVVHNLMLQCKLEEDGD